MYQYYLFHSIFTSDFDLKKCVHSASVRCAYFTTSLRVDRVSIAFIFENESVKRRDHANRARKSRERERSSFSAREARSAVA